MKLQKTITNEVKLSGAGLHSGNKVNIRFKPAEINTGVNFVRIDLPGNPVIAAQLSNIIDVTRRRRRTSIRANNAEVHTIEHAISGLAGLEIDNLIIEIDNDEMPCFDGSASRFVETLKKAGIVEQEAPKGYLTIKEPICIQEEKTAMVILPDEQFKVSYTLSYDHPLLKAQYVTFELDPSLFEKEIAPARTFCLECETDELTKQGLGGGADYKNTLVIGKKGVIENKFRFKDECARHKVLDIIGDIYLLGRPLKGHIIAIRSGHSMNLRLLRQLRHYEQKKIGAAIKGEDLLASGQTQLDINDIKKILPHRYPFLLVDRILKVEESKRIVGLKNVTAGEQFFTGHFPQRPIMPGVLVVEALAQTAGVLMLSRKENIGKLAYFVSMNNVKFRRTVVPGDRLILEVDVIKIKSRTGQVRTRALVEGKVACEAELMFSLVTAV
ncbi:MAG: bifunctional UDP-3-O-[3-hydroxymyristoyl] N-acetylglucosamine deacetylase/3-hydroxyacyl-ACP dehydratase [Candidatus Omnitrophota bacterium]|nr:bifunctional UDP-3-O-[3-hydroxymyristoyl] N-acetylglucosamine deacetylase/3-hydroxyacyl-ACP dehydratase [Candidatus Omnitrophota bacterium]